MKRFMVWIFGLMAMLATTLVFANATAYSVSGNVTAQTGAASPRLVRQGDTVRAGDTVITGAASSAVLKFEDGQIAAIGANSRMFIQASDYNAQAQTGNIVLNLLQGGMRAITGLIGRNNPNKVTYRAGNYTIGIRGTDVNIATEGGNVVVAVNDGTISFTVGGQTYTVTAGQGAFIRADGTVRTDVISAIVSQVQSLAPALNAILQNTGSISVPFVVPSSTGTPGTSPEVVTGTITPGPSGPSGSGGGGTASAR